MFERFTDRARRVVVLAQVEARRLNHNYIGTEHVLLGLIGDGHGIAAHVLTDAGVTLDAARAEILEVVGVGQQAPTGHIPFTPRTKKILELALREALDLGSDYIGTEHLLLGLIREGDGIGAQVLGRLSGGLDGVRTAVLTFIRERPAGSDALSEDEPGDQDGGRPEPGDSGERRRGGGERGERGERNERGERGESGERPGRGERGFAGPASALAFAERRAAVLRGMFQRRETAPVPSLREYVPGAPRTPERADDPVVERPEPTRRLLAALGRRERNNALIIGASGSGKSALVRGAARLLAESRGPASLKGAELVELDGLALRAGVERTVRRAASAIVLIEDLGSLLAADELAGGRIALGLAALAAARPPLVLTATDAAYERFALTYPALALRFSEVWLDGADAALTRRVLGALGPSLASFHRIEIADSALDAAVELGPGAIPSRAMPGAAVELLDTAAALASVRAGRDGRVPVLDARRVRAAAYSGDGPDEDEPDTEDVFAAEDAPDPGNEPDAGNSPDTENASAAEDEPTADDEPGAADEPSDAPDPGDTASPSNVADPEDTSSPSNAPDSGDGAAPQPE